MTNEDGRLQGLMTIPEVAEILHLSRAKTWNLVRDRKLPVIRIDRAVRVHPASLERWIAGREEDTK